MPKITVPKNDEVIKLDHRTHIYKLPDTYIGSIENTKELQYLKNEETNIFEKKEIELYLANIKFLMKLLLMH